MTSKIIVNVAFNLANPLHDLIVETSLEIREKYGSSWYVDDQRYFLHLSLYLLAAPLRNKQKIIEISREFVKELRVIKVESKGLILSDSGLVMISFAKNKAIDRYHRRALELNNPLREGLMRDKYEDENFRTSLPKADREKLEKYRHIYVLDRYEPHVTIAKIDDEILRQQIKKEYGERLLGQRSMLEKLQVHEAIFGNDGRIELMVDEELR